jgi:hypothetical protein
METVGALGKIQITINVTIALLVIVTGGALVTLYILYPTQKDLLVFCAAVLAGMSAIYSAFHVGQSLRMQIARDRMHRSFELMGQFTSIDFTKLRHFIAANVNYKQMAPEEIYKKITEQGPLEQAVLSALNWFEGVSIAVQKDYVEEDTLYSSLAYVIPFYFQALKPFIDQERKHRFDNLLYIELEKLVNAWIAQTYLSTKKKIEEQ